MTDGLSENLLDLDAYFQRIGYDGERTPTMATLQAIHARHASTIPFENLTPFLHQPVNLDLASLQHKLVQSGRGGYCFEQNLLLHAVLRALGFQVTGLAARVRWNVPDYEVSSWYLSNHPGSHFVTGLMAARPDRDCRYALRNNQLTIHRLHGDTERRMLTTAAELRAVLEDAFHITLPITPELDPALQRLIELSKQASSSVG